MTSSNVPFCPDCGTVLEEFVTRAEFEEAEQAIADLQAEHLKDMRALKNMKRRLEDASADVPKQDEEVFVEWCLATGRDPKKMKFGEGRQRAIRRMRRARPPYTQEQLLQAVRLAGKYRYLVFGRWSETGAGSDRKDDLLDIFRDEKRIESLLAKGG